MKAVERCDGALLALRFLVPVCGLAGITTAHADVTFTPSIKAGVAHTDNLTLVADNPEPETVYELIPGFNFRETGARISSDVNYSAEAYYYANRRDSSVFQIYNADFKATLDPDNFFLGFGAGRGQAIRDPQEPIPTSNLPITGNRVDRDDYYVGPEFQYRLGANATVHGSYRRNHTTYPGGATVVAGGLTVAELDTNTTGFSVDNYRKEHGLTWAANYTSDQTDYGAHLPKWEFRHAAIELGTWVGKGTRLFASAGKESPWDDPTDPTLRDDFYEFGFSKRVGKDFNVDVAGGQRSFGTSRRAAVSYTFLHGQTSLSYTDGPMTMGRMPTDYLTRPGAVERFISRRLDWGLGFRLRRAELSLSIFDETREQRTGITGAPLDNQAQSGGSVVATWHLGPRTGVYVGAATLSQQYSANGRQDLRSGSVGASRTLGARTDLTLDFRHTDSKSATVQSYVANLTTLLLTRRF